MFIISPGAFRKQQQDSEAFRVECLKRVDALQGIVNKLEREISVLRSQWNSNKDTINTLSEQIAPSQEAAHTLTARLVEMEQKEESVWALLRETREGLEELKRSTGDEHSSLGKSRILLLCPLQSDQGQTRSSCPRSQMRSIQLVHTTRARQWMRNLSRWRWMRNLSHRWRWMRNLSHYSPLVRTVGGTIQRYRQLNHPHHRQQ